LISWRVDRVEIGLLGGVFGRISASIGGNNSGSLPLPRRRWRVGAVLCLCLITASFCGGEGVVRRAWTPALLRPVKSGQRGLSSGSSWRFRPPSSSGQELELVCCCWIWWSALGSSGGVVGALLAFWRRIWRRRRSSQVRSSTKFSSLDGERLKWRLQNLFGVFLAGREAAFLVLLRRRCRRSTGGWFDVDFGVECMVCGYVGCVRLCSCPVIFV
jgi:hypothetical protein